MGAPSSPERACPATHQARDRRGRVQEVGERKFGPPTASALAAAVGLGLLEVFVAFLQAYVFALLTAVFVGAAVHPQH